MRANVNRIQKYRKYSEEFKRELVKEFEMGNYSVPQLEKLHGVSNRSIYKWIYKYSRYNDQDIRVVEMKQSSSEQLKALERKIKELEAMVGRKQIQIDYLETMMEVAKEELNIDIKKNYSTPPSVNSKKDAKR